MRTPGGLFVLASNPFTAKSRSFLQHNMLHDALASDFGTAVTKPIRIGTAPMAPDGAAGGERQSPFAAMKSSIRSSSSPKRGL